MAESSSSSCSPPAPPRYYLRRRPRNPRSKSPRANWSAADTKVLLDLCIIEKKKSNFGDEGLSRDGLRNVHRGCREANINCCEKQIRNKLNGLKKEFNLWKNRMAQEPIGHSRAGTSSRRGTRDHIVDSPQKGRRSYTVHEYVASLSESIKERKARHTEQEEVAEVMEMLRADGVSQGSELFQMALDLFQKRACRIQYKLIYDKANRLKYIDWTWRNSCHAW